MVYRRTIQDKGEDQLLVANADGSGEQVIFRHEYRDQRHFITDPSWSASGDLIAVAALTLGKNTLASILVLTPEGKLVKSFPLPMIVQDLHGCPILPGCSLSAVKNRTGLRLQIWFQPYPAGEPFKISNDLSRLHVAQRYGGRQVVRHHPGAPGGNDLRGRFSGCPERQDRLEADSDFDRTSDRLRSLLDRCRQTPATWMPPIHVYITGADGSNRVRLLEND